MALNCLAAINSLIASNTLNWVRSFVQMARMCVHLSVTCEIARRAVALPDIHRDPAYRIIIATAIVHDAKLASVDSVYPGYQDLQGRLVGQ